MLIYNVIEFQLVMKFGSRLSVVKLKTLNIHSLTCSLGAGIVANEDLWLAVASLAVMSTPAMVILGFLLVVHAFVDCQGFSRSLG